MRFYSFLDFPKATWSRSGRARMQLGPVRRRSSSCKSQLEHLEDRCLLSFLPAVEYSVGPSPHNVVLADFNGDTRLDIAVANFNSSVSVLLGNADGTFQPALNSAGSFRSSLAVGHFNADSNLDLVTMNGDQVSVLRGNGDGTLQSGQNFNLSTNNFSLAVGDLDANGSLDLVATSNRFTCTNYGYYGCYDGFNTGHVNVVLGNGDGTFAAPTAQSFDLIFLTSAVLRDFNGDGKLDLATVDPSLSFLRVFAGHGNGTFASPTAYATDSSPQSVVVGDVNGDSISDLVTRNSSGLSVFLGNGDAGVGDGTFQTARNTAPNSRFESLAVGDINDDGKLDLVAASNSFTCNYYGYYGGCYGSVTSGHVHVLLGFGDGAFAPSRTSNIENATVTGIATGDFNGDGYFDAALTKSATSISVLINDKVWPSEIIINDVTVTEGNAGSVNATFTVSVSPASDQLITFHYETADGSATAGSDYTPASGDLSFAAGEISQDITIAVRGDRVPELREFFLVTLSAPTNATVADSQGIGFILDNEPRISIDDVAVTEGNTGTVNAMFTVTLSVAYDEAVTVRYDTANDIASAGSDYTSVSGNVIFGIGETTKPIMVAVNGDRLAEPAESFFVNLSAPPNAELSDGQGAGTILDDEPLISVDNVMVTEGNVGTVNATFTVTLSASYDEPVTVPYSTSNGDATAGSDYTAALGSVIFGIGETSKPITIAVIGDRLAEVTEYFWINLSAPTNASLLFGSGSAAILDDEPRIRIDNNSVREGNSGTKAMIFTVTLSAAYDQTVTVKFSIRHGSARAGSDYASASRKLTFAAGETTKTITVLIKGDTKRESDEHFQVILRRPSSNGMVDALSGGFGTIINDDSRRR